MSSSSSNRLDLERNQRTDQTQHDVTMTGNHRNDPRDRVQSQQDSSQGIDSNYHQGKKHWYNLMPWQILWIDWYRISILVKDITSLSIQCNLFNYFDISDPLPSSVWLFCPILLSYACSLFASIIFRCIFLSYLYSFFSHFIDIFSIIFNP